MMSKPSPSARRAVSCHAERESFGSNPTPNRKSLVINGDAMRVSVLAVFGPGSGEGHSHIVGNLHRADEHREKGVTPNSDWRTWTSHDIRQTSPRSSTLRSIVR